MAETNEYQPHNPLNLHEKVDEMLLADEVDQGTNMDTEELLSIISEHYIR